MATLSVISSLVEAIGVMAVLSVAFGSIERSRFPGVVKGLLVGLLFGSGALVTMVSPVELVPGLQIDGRSIVVGMGAAFGGWLAGAVAAIIAGSYRLYLGGAGAVPGAIGILLAAMLGYAWIKLCPCRGRPAARHLTLAGVMTSLSFFAVYLLPVETANRLVAAIYPWLLLASVCGAVLLGMLVERERRLFETMSTLRKASEIDRLTGLPNRRVLDKEVPRAASLRPAPGRRHFVILLDIDRFKAINDTWGHDAGDLALVAFSGVLREVCRKDDVVLRMGGEEFAIFVNNVTLEGAKALTDRILSKTRQISIEVGQERFGFTVSAGLAPFESDMTSVSDVLMQADRALYKAKQGGRDQMQLDLEAA